MHTCGILSREIENKKKKNAINFCTNSSTISRIKSSNSFENCTQWKTKHKMMYFQKLLYNKLGIDRIYSLVATFNHPF